MPSSPRHPFVAPARRRTSTGSSFTSSRKRTSSPASATASTEGGSWDKTHEVSSLWKQGQPGPPAVLRRRGKWYSSRFLQRSSRRCWRGPDAALGTEIQGVSGNHRLSTESGQGGDDPCVGHAERRRDQDRGPGNRDQKTNRQRQ